ncbi:MAG: PAS domain S-box protein, partial [Nitrospina sp.]|nr:PAS domain S-box protein [Nitrospina sp.]
MGFVSYKIKFAILGAMVVPCFGRLALHGTGSEHDLYRYFVPILVGGLAGYFIGLMKDKWVVKNEELETTNEFLKQEIDERKRAKDVVRESERKYRNIYDNAQIGLFRSRLEDGKMVMANNRMAEIFGYKDAEECVSNYVAAEHWVYPEVRDKLVETMREHGKVTKFEAPIRKDDGSIIWIQFSGTLSSEEDYFEGVVADITERKQAEEALRDSEERYRTLMDNLPVAVYRNTPGPKGEFLMANPAFCKMFGFK